MGENVNGAGLRERNTNTTRHVPAEEAKQAVQELNAMEFNSEKDMKDKRTFGRTPNGIGKCFNSTFFAQDNIGRGYRAPSP